LSSDLPAQRRRLVTQHEDLSVLRRLAPAEHAESAHRHPQDQVEQSQSNEPAIMPDRLRRRTSRSSTADEVVGTDRVRSVSAEDHIRDSA